MKVSPRICFLICFLFFTTAFGQEIPSPNPNPTPPAEDNDVVKISTNLIQVDVTVTDKKGNPVKDLKAEDFEIYENDKNQQITNFSFVELQPDKSLLNKPAETIITKPNKNSIPIPSIPNQLRPEQVRRTFALIVDDLSLSFTSTDTVRSALKKFVDEQMQPNDLVAIIRTSGGTGVLQQFTSDKRMLYAAIERIRWYPGGRGNVSAFAPVESTLKEEMKGSSMSGSSPEGEEEEREANREFDQFREDFFAVGTLGAVNSVVGGMRELPGRKAVVLFSDGFKLYSTYRAAEGKEIKPGINQRLITAFQHLTDLANRSAVIVYTMDARGLINPMLGAEDRVYMDPLDETMAKRLDAVENERSAALQDSQQGLRVLAQQTGGFAVINNNDLSRGMERVLNDQKGYYLLGYQPDDETFDPKKARFNKLVVKLKRSDLSIRYRSGFYGIRDEEVKPQPKTPRQQILAALTSPLSSGEIDLQLTSLFASDAQTGDFMRSLIYVNGKNLKFTEEAGGWQKATFDIAAMIFGDNGVIIDEVNRTETIKARAETLQEVREKGFVATITVPVKKPGAYQMRVVMRDAATSKIGSASQFIEVPNLKRNRLTLSGILLQRNRPQTNEKISIERKEFQSDEQRDVAERSFHPGMDVRFGYAIYNAKLDKASNLPNLTMQFKIFRDGKETFASKEKSVNLTEKADLKHLLAEGSFKLGKTIQSGNYILQLIVRDLYVNGKAQTTAQWIDFEVVN